MSADLPYILWWWAILFLLGVGSFPLTFNLFNRFFDRGYPFAKILGIVFLTYSFFLAAHLKIATLTLSWLAFFSVLLITIQVLCFKKTIPVLQSFVKQSWKMLVLEEFLFLLGLIFWSGVRGYTPETRGLEKFMDFGFVNAMLTSKILPPPDMWLAQASDYSGHFINYYYFGHLYTAVLTRLTSIDSAITYNLAIATLFALCFTAAFSLGGNLFHLFNTIRDRAPKIKLVLIAGIMSAFLVALGGNLHTIYTFYNQYENENPLPFWNLGKGCEAEIRTKNPECFSLMPASSTFPNGYWYPNATRFIPNTIHEFPIYSFVVADLHGHVSDIPFVLLTLAVLLQMISFSIKLKHTDDTQHKHSHNTRHQIKFSSSKHTSNDNEPTNSLLSPMYVQLIFIGLMVAVMYMTNAWDGLIYLILAGVVFLFINYQRYKSTEDNKFNLSNTIIQTGIQSLIVVIAFLLFSLPFSMNFKPFVSGVGVVGGWEIADKLGWVKPEGEYRSCPICPTPLANTVIGADGKPDVLHIGPLLLERGKNLSSPWWMLLVLWGFFVYTGAGFIAFVVLPHLKDRKLSKNSFHPTDRFAAILILISALLLIFPEYFYMKDIYPLHYRANTMFKLGYQAFMMMMIVSVYTFLRVLFGGSKASDQSSTTLYRSTLFAWIMGFFVCFYLVGIYPYFAINSYYGGLKVYKGIDGLTWLKETYPEDYKAISWLRREIELNHLSSFSTHPPVIVEAVGDSYTDYARVSANTGLPTIVGWPVHEWLWRGSYDEPGKRIPLVETIYTSEDSKRVKGLLDTYNVSYIFVGTLERQKYPTLTEDVFKALGTVVYENGETRIYQLRNRN